MLCVKEDLAAVPRRRSEDSLPVDGASSLKVFLDTLKNLKCQEDYSETELLI